MGDFRKKKNILQTDFEGKKILQGKTWQKNPYTMKKKIYFMAYKAEKKSYIVVCHDRFGKNIPSQTKSPIPHPLQKSNG